MLEGIGGLVADVVDSWRYIQIGRESYSVQKLVQDI